MNPVAQNFHKPKRKKAHLQINFVGTTKLVRGVSLSSSSEESFGATSSSNLEPGSGNVPFPKEERRKTVSRSRGVFGSRGATKFFLIRARSKPEQRTMYSVIPNLAVGFLSSF